MIGKTISHYRILSLEGQRFFMFKPVEHREAAPTQINVVLN
jgi:hypothetical protein